MSHERRHTMKWIRMFSAAITLFGLTASVDAGLFGLGGCDKGCGCAEDCQPECCKPTISRPCCANVYTYQRKCSDIKPPCCDSCCAPNECCAPANSCGNNGGSGCCENTCCAPAGDCCGDNACCENTCCAPAGDNACCENICAAPAACCGTDSNCCGEGCCSEDDCCEIAKLIYTSMTACYARDRRKALHTLGDDYECCCHPEIMKAFICGLNDTDEKVRKKAADEIGDQLRANCCCCSPELTSALTCALGDCDRGVRRQAEEALEECGYEVVDGCCDTGCCDTGCCNSCGSAPAAQAAPAPAAAPASEAVPAPAPPEEPQAYYPSRLRKISYSVKSKSGLAGLFGLAK
jgi:hypothetical protein